MASIQKKTWRETSPYFSYVIYVARPRYITYVFHTISERSTRELFNLKILVIEDNVEISEALSFFFGAKKDIECQAINTGQEGLNNDPSREF